MCQAWRWLWDAWEECTFWSPALHSSGAPSSSLSLSFPSVKWGCSLTGLCEGWMRSCLCAAGLMALHTVGAYQSVLLVQSGLGIQSRHLLGEALVTAGAVSLCLVQVDGDSESTSCPSRPSPLSPPHRFLSITPLPTWPTGI